MFSGLSEKGGPPSIFLPFSGSSWKQRPLVVPRFTIGSICFHMDIMKVYPSVLCALGLFWKILERAGVRRGCARSEPSQETPHPIISSVV